MAQHEAALLKSLIRSLLGVLDERESGSPTDELEQITGIKTGNATPPKDALLRRLLPDFHRPDDPEESADGLNSALRILREPEIIAAKRVAAQRVLGTAPDGGGRFELTEEDAHAWVAAVNDLRLALGTRLEITEIGPDSLPEGHPMAAHLDVYQWLTVMQEYLLLALLGTR